MELLARLLAMVHRLRLLAMVHRLLAMVHRLLAMVHWLLAMVHRGGCNSRECGFKTAEEHEGRHCSS